jgi:XisI protein
MEAIVIPATEKQTHYRELVRQLLHADAQAIRPSHGDIEALVLVDERQESVMLIYIGWSGNVRHHDVMVHARMRDGKVWIERDGTAEGFATTLVAAGVPAEDIVLAFQHPRKRPYTGFGTEAALR